MYAFSATSHQQLEDIRAIGDLDIPETARDVHMTAEQAKNFLSIVENQPDAKYLRKDIEDTAAEKITFEKGIDAKDESTLDKVTITSYMKSPAFTPGFLGEGFKLFRDDGGNWNLDIDNLLVRKNMDVFQITINKIRHVGGAILFSSAASEIERVEETPDYYRCYVKEPDNNYFVQFDQAICQIFTGTKIKRYWRLVTSVAADGSYFDLSKTDAESGSGVPEAGDEVVQLGHRSEYARQNAIYLSSYGTYGPYQQFLSGVNSYSLAGKIKIQISEEETFFRANRFEIISSNGASYRIPIDRGTWVPGTYNYYERVSHNGSLWLCIAQPSTNLEPMAGSMVWQEQVKAGEKGDKGDMPIRVEKWNTPGYEMYREGTPYSATLGIKIFQGDEDITSTINIARFVWTRLSINEAGDSVWNDLHVNSGASVDITEADLVGDTSFIVQFWDESKVDVLNTTIF
jgi:hypothetical protein